MRKKLQSVLDRVREPETGLSVAELNLVRRIRYFPEERALRVFLNQVRPAPACCSIISGLLLNSTLKALATELSKEFPDLTIQLPE